MVSSAFSNRHAQQATPAALNLDDRA